MFVDDNNINEVKIYDRAIIFILYVFLGIKMYIIVLIIEEINKHFRYFDLFLYDVLFLSIIDLNIDNIYLKIDLWKMRIMVINRDILRKEFK